MASDKSTILSSKIVLKSICLGLRFVNVTALNVHETGHLKQCEVPPLANEDTPKRD